MLRFSSSVITQELMTHFHITSTALGGLISAYYYGYVPLQLISGMLMDKFGTKWILVLSSLISSIGAILFGMGYSLLLSVVGRFLIGIGSGCAFIACVKITRDVFPAKRFDMFLGMVNIMGTIGAIVAGKPLIKLMDILGWQSTYYLFAVVGVVLAFCLLISGIKDSRQRVKNEKQKLVFFDKQLWFISIASALIYSIFSVFGELWGVDFLKASYHIVKSKAAVIMSFLFVGMVIGNLFMTQLANKWCKYIKILQICAFANAVLFLSLTFYPLSYLYVVVFSMGFLGASQILIYAWINRYCSSDILGTSMGFCNMITMLSGLLLQPFIGWMLDYCWLGISIGGVRYYDAQSYVYAMMILPICLLSAVFVFKKVES